MSIASPRKSSRRRRRDGRSAADSGSATRRCIASGDLLSKAGMLRFVIGPEGDVVPDLEEKLPGRGLWLSADRDVVNTACAKNLFSKAARRQVTVANDLPARVDALLAGRCAGLIGLARRAGEVEAGFEKVRSRLRGGTAGLVLAASDGADDGRRKIRALAPDVPLCDVMSGVELGRALARDNVVHVAVAPGRLADRLQSELNRLAGIRQGCAGG